MDNSFCKLFVEWHSGKSAVSFGNPFLWLLFVWALPRFFVWFAVFLLTKRKSGWGNLRVVVVVGPGLSFGFACFYGPTVSLYKCLSDSLFSCKGPRPLSDIGQTREEKKNPLFFFGPSPLPFGGSTVLSLTRGPAGNRTTTGSLSATQECRDTNCTTRTTPLDHPSAEGWARLGIFKAEWKRSHGFPDFKLCWISNSL